MDLLSSFDEKGRGYNQDVTSQMLNMQQLQFFEARSRTIFNLVSSANQPKNLNRRRRKPAVKMISEISSERIDDLLKMYNEKYSIYSTYTEENDEDYSDISQKLPSATDPDYMYENLYDDEKDLAIPPKSRHNTEYGSFQDLILQATQSKWQRETDETKLHTLSNKHYIVSVI